MKTLLVIQAADGLILEELSLTVMATVLILLLINLETRWRTDVIVSNQRWRLLHRLFLWKPQRWAEWLPLLR